MTRTSTNPQVLHVIEPHGAGCGPSTLACVARIVAHDDEARVLVLGNQAATIVAGAAGCRVDGMVPIPLGVPRLAAKPLRRAWRRLPAPRVIAWSEAAAVAITSLPAEVALHARLAAAVGRCSWVEPWRKGRVGVVGIGQDAGSVLASRGWRVGPELALEDLPWPAPSGDLSRPRLRDRWGATSDEIMLGAVADPPEMLDLLSIYTACLIARVAGKAIRIVAHPDSGRRAEAQRFEQELARTDPDRHVPLVFDSSIAQPAATAAGIDVAVALCREPRGRNELDSMLLPWAWHVQGVRSLATRGGCPQEEGVILLASNPLNALATKLLQTQAEPVAVMA